MKRVNAGFKAGDQVVAVVTKPEIQMGAHGTIVQVWGSNRYIVQFNTTLVFMWGYEIGRITDASRPTSSTPGRETRWY